MMWELALNHANIFSGQQTVGKMSDYELLSPDNSGSGWDNVLLAQKINKRGEGGCNKNVLVCTFFKKLIVGGDVYSGLESKRTRHGNLNQCTA